MKTSSIKREQMTDPTTGTRPFTPYIESRKTIIMFSKRPRPIEYLIVRFDIGPSVKDY